LCIEKYHKGVIELPMPKPNVYYKSGWEHAEFVIQEDLNEFAKKHAHIQWNLDGLSKSFNKDVAVDLDKNIDTRLTAKFHNMNLERVIEIEKQGL
jgi:predicted metalloenzyme YecM